MAEQYAGNPNNYPEDYTIPDDADPPTAAAVNVALEALGDRTAYLKSGHDALSARTGQLEEDVDLSVLNLQVAFPGVADAFRAAVYNPVDLRWYIVGGVGGTAEVRASHDWGKSWSTDSLIDSVDDGEECWDADYASNGDMIVATDTPKVFMRLSGSWSVQTAFSSAASVPAGAVYDHVNGNWLVVSGTATGTILAATSANGATWSQSTIEGGGGFARPRLHMRRDTCRIVISYIKTAGVDYTLITRYSDDGGASWSTPAEYPLPGGPSPGLSFGGAIHYNPTTDRWLLFVTAPLNYTRIYESADNGANWTLKASLTDVHFSGRSFGAIGELWIAQGLKNGVGVYLYYSLDGGETWRCTPQGFDTGASDGQGVYVAPKANGFLALTRSYAYMSHVRGAPDLGLAT